MTLFILCRQISYFSYKLAIGMKTSFNYVMTTKTLNKNIKRTPSRDMMEYVEPSNTLTCRNVILERL